MEVTITLVSNISANGGVITRGDDGKFMYDPPDNFNGEDTFSYIVTGPQGQTDTATVTVTVSDTFVYDTADGSTQTIENFDLGPPGTAGVNYLDLKGLLIGEETGVLRDYISVTDAGVGNDVTLRIDADGLTGGTGEEDLTIILQGAGTGSVDLSLLIDNEQLLVDT